MDRRKFLTTMLQGSLASVLLPNSIAPLLVAQHDKSYHDAGNYQQNLHISAIGIGAYGSTCTRLLASSGHAIDCCELPSPSPLFCITDAARLVTASPQAELLFLFADTRQHQSSDMLKTYVDSASRSGVQVVVVSPQPPDHKILPILTNSEALHCTEPDPVAASSMITTVSDIANYGSFIGIDTGDVKAILQKGNTSVFASAHATGPSRGSLASQSVLAQLEQQVGESDIYNGAVACIYCNSDTYFHDFDQAIIELFRFFLPNSTSKFNIIYNCVIDNSLHDSVRVSVLAVI